MILDPSFFEGINLKNKYNEFCSQVSENSTRIDKLVCKNDFKKQNYIWVFLDGLAYDQLYLLTKENSIMPNIHKMFTDSYRQSGSLHDSYLTGKFSRNYIAKKIEIDYILKQIKRADYNSMYIGTNFPLYFLTGENNNEVFMDIRLKSAETYPFENMCYWSIFIRSTEIEIPEKYLDNPESYNITELREYLIEKYDQRQIDPEKFTECLINSGVYSNMATDVKRSLVFYTMLMDHLSHAYFKTHPLAIRASLSLELGLIAMMKWVGNHPDYVLIISSDHGGQKYNGEDVICNHGCMEKGNEGIFILSTDQINEEFKNKIPIIEESEIYSIAPTVAQFLDNVNIPLESKGLPYTLSNNTLLEVISLRSKEAQLQEYLRHYKQLNPSFKDIDGKNLFYYEKLSEFKTKKEIKKFIKDDYIFMVQYRNYLIKYQNELFDQINKSEKKANLYIISLCVIFSIKLVFQIKVLIKSLDFVKKISFSMIILLVWFLVLYLIPPFFLIFSVKNFTSDYIRSNYTFIFIFSIFSVYFYFLVGPQKYNKISSISDDSFDKEAAKSTSTTSTTTTNADFMENLSNILLRKKFLFSSVLFICSSVLLTYLFYIDFFGSAKNYCSNYKTAKKIDSMNYAIYIAYFIAQMIYTGNYYYDQCKKINIKFLLTFYVLAMSALMFYYDHTFPKHFINQDLFRQGMVRTIYYMHLGLLLFIFMKTVYTIDGEYKKFNLSLRLLKIPILSFTFFICDEAERIFIFVITLPILILYLNYAKLARKITNVEHSDYFRLITTIGLLKIPYVLSILYVLQFTFDVSLKSGNKSIGYYPDEYPAFTGFLFGAHKVKIYLCGIAFILERHLKLEKKGCIYNFTKETKDFFSLMDLRVTLGCLLFLYVVYSRNEALFITVSLFLMSKVFMLICFPLILILINIFSLTKCLVCCGKNNKKDSNLSSF